MAELIAADYEMPVSRLSQDQSKAHTLPDGRVIVVDYARFVANVKAATTAKL